MRFPIAALVFLCLSTAAAAAEPDSVSLKKGDRVRVTIAGMQRVCIIEEMQPGVLSLRSSETAALQRVRIADISSLEIRAPRSPGRGAGRGAFIGGGIGLLGGIVTGIVSGDDEPNTIISFTAAEKALVLGMTLTMFGTIIGAIVGAVFPGEHWEKIPLDARLDAGASRNGSVSVGITFPIGGS
jgi:hypothetical protein